MCFNRAIFEKDLVEIAKRTKVNLLIFENEHYTILANTFLADDVRCQMLYFKTDNPTKEELYQFLLKIISRFKNALRFDGFLNSNIIYYQDHEWAKVSRDNEIPFLTLCKEVPATEKNEKFWISDWKDFPYHGHGIAVYSDWTKQILRDKCNVGKNVPYQVVGCPRTDIIYDIFEDDSYNTRLNKDVVFFDFVEYGKKELWESSIKQFETLSKKYDENGSCYNFIIKTKYKEDADHIKKHFGFNQKRNNLTVTHDIDIKEIASNAILLCGFRTTALIKLMYSDVNVIILNWGEAKEDPDDNFITEEFCEACEMADSLYEFTDKVDEALGPGFAKTKGFRTQRNQLIEKHLYKMDGSSSKRAEEFFKETILSLNYKKK